jgi:hypothetical protein
MDAVFGDGSQRGIVFFSIFVFLSDALPVGLLFLRCHFVA